uniref:Glyco_transf_64 domain-containing protein n=1 Tax=Caenorhabditis tropicalis TaxID=1561998 RepID=A0A1I7V434_9PELO
MISRNTDRNVLLILIAICTIGIFAIFYWSDDYHYALPYITMNNSGNVEAVAEVKKGNKWIVVTSISSPTEDVKRLASMKEWNVVVVADTKTPFDWKLDGVHLLSVEYQKQLPFSLVSSLPFKSYTRKNIGYLYAIYHGAEWIYDTDDDNKPYDELGLNQFQYKDTVSGIRYRVNNETDGSIINRLFNPYRFYGMDQMWPRGFPLEHIEKHTNGNSKQVSCYKMKRASVQQGLVHHDPDVDAIYRLLNADSNSGLDVKFNKFAPPITLSVGTYSPWNSQNTLFHKSAFHTLFLPTTVSFRTTDIWRSFISQKILHLSGLTVSFVPTNAVQFRNAHYYLKDFKDEKQVYEDSGKMIQFLHKWKCSNETSIDLEGCIGQLTQDLVEENLWGKEDADLMEMFLKDLKVMGYKFPELIGDNYTDPYAPSTNETSRDVNCRRMHLEFDLINPKEDEEEDSKKSAQKINYFGDLVEWCNETGYSNLSKAFPSPAQLQEEHEESYVLQKDKNSVLIAVNNFPWKYGVGLIQRLYQPYFASIIFCGSWYPDQIEDEDNFTSTIHPVNYIHMNPAEMTRGYFGYHCLTLVKEMGLSNVEGYFFMADDTVFNIWQRIDYSRVHHLQGIAASKRILKVMKGNKDVKLAKAWKHFEDGMRKYGYIKGKQNAGDEMLAKRGKSISDFFYIPTSESDYYATLMRLFYEQRFFLELAVNTFLKSVNYQNSLDGPTYYLWGGERGQWAKFYNKDAIGMHPVKMSAFRKPGENRKKYCETVLQTWSNIMFRGARNFTVKGDKDPDYENG